MLLFHYIIIIFVEGGQQRPEGSKGQCCENNYTENHCDQGIQIRIATIKLTILMRTLSLRTLTSMEMV